MLVEIETGEPVIQKKESGGIPNSFCFVGLCRESFYPLSGLVLLDDGSAVELRVLEEVVATVGDDGQTLSVDTVLVYEHISDIVSTLLGELHVALCRTGLAVSVAGDGELGALARRKDLVCDACEVSLLENGRNSLADLEVDICGLLEDVAGMLLCVCELLLEVLVLILEGCVLCCECLSLLGSGVLGSDSGSGSCSSGCESGLVSGDSGSLACPVGLAEVEGETAGYGNIGCCAADRVVIEVACVEGDSACVNEEAHAVAETECVQETCACCEALASVCGDQTCGEVGNEIVDPLLLVAPELVGDIPKEVAVEIVVLEAVGVVERVLETLPAGTDTPARLDPLADEYIGSEAGAVCEVIVYIVKSDVDTTAYTGEPVVKELVGLVRSILDLAVCIPVALLCECACSAGEKCS